MQEVQFYERAQAQTHSMIRNLPEEMVVDRRTVPYQRPNVALAAHIAETHLSMAGFAAVHEWG
jgi:hypothetical protein